MKTFKRWLHQRLAELDELASHVDPNEGVWARSAAIVAEAGDRAGRLSLPDLYDRSRQTIGFTGPEDAKAFLFACLAALTPTPDVADEMLTLAEAAKLLGYTDSGFRKIIERSKRALAGQRVNAPTIEFAQAGVKGAIHFRREWVDAFIAGKPPTAKTATTATKRTVPRAKSRHGLR